ncbi:hypothetical protein E2562_029114 [Oryza meyeriana var. granulata]|uniref:Uncharacterized protein n=1 Tax=Oryza meyeriana var. granulata TaxID=110450 RepID=A0A6G1EBV4_9ORYZ|nr:hypothetical protein E2562_029114 [Oryza meyeriana var. granulata]
MIKTTPEKWEVIEEDQKLKRYENKSFPLFESLDQLYEGQYAEGKHCFTSSKDNHVDLRGKDKAIANTTARKRPRDGSAGVKVHTDTLQRIDGIGWRSLEVESERDEEKTPSIHVKGKRTLGAVLGIYFNKMEVMSHRMMRNMMQNIK